MSWVLGAVLTAAPLVYSQQTAQDPQQQPPQTQPAATNQGNDGLINSPVAQPNSMPQKTSPQSDQAASTSSPFEQEMIFGTGMTVAELRQAGYNDQEIAKLRTDSQALMAAGTTAPAATGSQDQAPSAANSVSQPADPNSNSAKPAPASSSNHAGLWGLLGLLGLLGLAGRRRREVVADRNVSTMQAERDRLRNAQDSAAAERAARDRETAIVDNDRRIAAMDREHMRELDRESAEHAARDREIITANDYREQDIVADSDLPDRRLDDELRDRKVKEIRERERLREERQREEDRRRAA